jgi:uncharacterized protein (TIGR03435 family)
MNPALFTHLWQSTLIIVAVALLAWLLRKNHAQVRYWLWLVASVKFLIPFALLVTLGSYFSWPASAPVVQPQVSAAVEQISQPFTPLSVDSSNLAFAHSNAANPLPSILLAIWCVGFAAILCRWYANWRRVRALARAASPLPLDLGVPVLSSPGSMEPGIFGIWRPVLLLPEGITEKLASDQLKAVLAHELCHARRHDNLAAAIHKVVEAVFWFHPLVWWIGSRLIEERERACDEEVLRTGSKPEVYAEGILNTCRFYLESPSACMSGVTGAELKERIVRIMSHRAVHRLGPARKLLLAMVTIAAVAGPIAFGLMSAPQEASKTDGPKFEVASIKPAKPGARGTYISNKPGGRFTVMNMSTKDLIILAYSIQPFQLSGGPSWLNSDRYDIEAKPEHPVNVKPGMSYDQLQNAFDEQMQRLQSLLKDRCKLTFHRETKEAPVYALVIAKSGPKIPAAQTADKTPRLSIGMGQLSGKQVPISELAKSLSRQLGRVVIDKTNLQGNYDFTLKWTPEERSPQALGPAPMGKDAPPPPDPNGPSLFTALQEQLGLKLESQKGPVEILVIDHVEKPSEN